MKPFLIKRMNSNQKLLFKVNTNRRKNLNKFKKNIFFFVKIGTIRLSIINLSKKNFKDGSTGYF